MTDKTIEIIREQKYAPPYPQSFYAFWPKHAIRAGGLITALFLGLLLLSTVTSVPMDPNMPPLPDDGAYVPAPEWYLFFLFQPFWYLAGDDAKWLPLGTFWLPLLAVAFLFLVPVLFRKREAVVDKGSGKWLLATLVGAVWLVCVGSVVGSGAPAKTTGCTSCHNPLMGDRQALPPLNMAEYYQRERQRQVDLGGYNIGSTDHKGGSYKDANWQLRHFYEPTMTW